MKNHQLKQTIESLFQSAYRSVEADEDYQETFDGEGLRKAQYIIDDLQCREAEGQLRIGSLGYLCIGGADGSEVDAILRNTDISKAALIEISDAGIRRAEACALKLAGLGKTLKTFHGDVTARLDAALTFVENWCHSRQITGLICFKVATAVRLFVDDSPASLSAMPGVASEWMADS